MLFKYLTEKQIPISIQVTKITLIDKIIDYWRNHYYRTAEPGEPVKQEQQASPPQYHQQTTVVQQQTHIDNVENFPINVMSRSFVSWFFEHYNQNSIQESDFWKDVQLYIMTEHSMGVNEESFMGSSNNIAALTDVKQRYNLYFNPNVCHQGVQGRMDQHGLIIVLSCGTLHTTELCVGTFESIFGLSRDPFSENNWKIKYLKLKLINRSVIEHQPILEHCQTLLELVEMPQSDSVV